MGTRWRVDANDALADRRTVFTTPFTAGLEAISRLPNQTFVTLDIPEASVWAITAIGFGSVVFAGY